MGRQALALPQRAGVWASRYALLRASVPFPDGPSLRALRSARGPAPPFLDSSAPRQLSASRPLFPTSSLEAVRSPTAHRFGALPPKFDASRRGTGTKAAQVIAPYSDSQPTRDSEAPPRHSTSRGAAPERAPRRLLYVAHRRGWKRLRASAAKFDDLAARHRKRAPPRSLHFTPIRRLWRLRASAAKFDDLAARHRKRAPPRSLHFTPIRRL